MPTDDPEVKRLLNDLKTWCEGSHGRRTQIAKAIGVDRRRITDWLSGRVLPSLAMGLRVRAFLEAQPREEKRVD
jgi:transcriptional regulator with XRE-family HTH domain